MKKSATSNPIFIDPVCYMKVSSGNKNLMLTYKMRSYYFCAEACLKAFEATPEKYLDSKPRNRKGWWGRYLDRLKKSTDGKAQKCH